MDLQGAIDIGRLLPSRLAFAQTAKAALFRDLTILGYVRENAE